MPGVIVMTQALSVGHILEELELVIACAKAEEFKNRVILFLEEFMVNRAALILKYKVPAINWVNEADPVEPNPQITEDFINSERTVYLISEEDAWDEVVLEGWIKRNYLNLFESELEGWYTDPKLWPKPRTLELFQAWFEVECHTILVDTVGTTIFDDEI